jgi:hypothetical protein
VYGNGIVGDIMVGEMFHSDTLRMIAMRQAAATSLATQNTAILNVEAAKAEARRNAEQGHYITNPAGANPVIMKPNSIGAPSPSISAMRSLTPNGAVRNAMSPRRVI